MTSPALALECETFPLIFAAPSGAGKTTIARELDRRRSDTVFSVSATTRSPRPHERNGFDYHFVSESAFRRMIDAGELAEWAEVHGDLYGTPLRNFAEAREGGKHLILDIDIEGAGNVRRTISEAVAVFVLPPSGAELVKRLVGRGSESSGSVARRLRRARRELEKALEFDYVVVNEELERSIAAVEAILAAEAARPHRMRGLAASLNRIGTEVDGVLETEEAAAASNREEMESE